MDITNYTKFKIIMVSERGKEYIPQKFIRKEGSKIITISMMLTKEKYNKANIKSRLEARWPLFKGISDERSKEYNCPE